MGTHLRVLGRANNAMNINMTGFRWFSKVLSLCALGKFSISFGRANIGLFSLDLLYSVAYEGHWSQSSAIFLENPKVHSNQL